ncbi:hypothetical protein IW261DRAFT_1608163 [Armillaria novae-zelandiae]|uniref:Secreted protein n=1 Tax=Armillaria novae-zelandiae TaxID=153914 RepID=A0AA39P8W7_9AGAR|nr:hypothetical protein IW261DRAFT_1608163 [Armillaria novae-zelandiae]
MPKTDLNSLLLFLRLSCSAALTQRRRYRSTSIAALAGIVRLSRFPHQIHVTRANDDTGNGYQEAFIWLGAIAIQHRHPCCIQCTRRIRPFQCAGKVYVVDSLRGSTSSSRFTSSS